MKHALRRLLGSPGFTFTVVLTLSLGIGANTAIFSVVNAVLLSPLPYANPDRIVSVQSRNQQENLHGLGFAPAGFRDFEKQTTSFEKIAATRYNYTNLTGTERPALLTDGLVTQDYFEVFGVKAFLGRTFTPADAAAGASPTVVLGHGIWQSQFAGRAGIIGETIMLDDTPHTVIGVMPRTFKEPFNTAALWRVFPNTGGENFATGARFWGVLALLKPDASPGAVDAELATIASRLEQSDPKFYEGWDFTTQPLHELVVGDFRDGLLLVIGAALLVLMITCANVAGLQLVRASTRQRDTAIRLALGASRWAIAREQLAESFLLVFVGGGAGVLLARWGQLIQVTQTGQAKFTAAMHDVVVGEWRIKAAGLTGICADGFDPQPQHVPFLNQEFGRGLMDTGRMRPLVIGVEESRLVIAPAGPTCL
jgi:predicted permease